MAKAKTATIQEYRTNNRVLFNDVETLNYWQRQELAKQQQEDCYRRACSTIKAFYH